MVFLILIVWPLAELAAAIAVAHFVGVLLCVLLLIAGWPVGSWLLRSEGRTALRHFREALAAGRSPAGEVAEGALVLIGGTLFIIPGFITDAFGLLVLIAPARRRLAALLVRHAQSRFVTRAVRFGSGPRRAYDVDSVATDAVPPSGPVWADEPGRRSAGFAFGTPDGALWGAALDGVPGADAGSAALVLGLGVGLGDTEPARSRDLRWVRADGDGWRLEGEGAALRVTPLEDRLTDSALCRVQGTIWLDSEREVDCPGVSVTLEPSRSGRHAPASARLVGGFFPNGTAVALLAARPGRGAHQDRDSITAALFDAEEWIAVRDPRLSTTYDEAGVPTRTNLELWIGEGDDEFPRRAAGEAAGPGGSVAVAGGALQVIPLRCHSRGEEGAGVYALARF